MELDTESSAVDDSNVLFAEAGRNGTSVRSKKSNTCTCIILSSVAEMGRLTQLVDNITPNTSRQILTGNRACIASTELVNL